MTIDVEFGNGEFKVKVFEGVAETFRQMFEALVQLYAPLAADVIGNSNLFQ